ncbi:CRISPR-associated endoribonuclease Cas6 (plasmid) [Kovacikia minuta CCNUW1]|uniref:CRISPR-associated endoribonuclease Cas6 n=1 Tax=Kovacikia minuta TaxID=2931930 RepID=UPI001CC94E48|nr:CRISPR-associated endoribonuclease Cas6 [Kovacikia minuta]UBF30653.1 CRISPR-associated endoribonuclease Cas6 [Kovacikia minuta CCNUW1]
MPHSLILNLVPTSPIPLGYLTGKHLHALFLTLVSSVDQSLGDRLHEQKADKAFTLSSLQVWMGTGVDGAMGNRVHRSIRGKVYPPQQSKEFAPSHPSTHPPIPSPTHLLQYHHTHPIPAGTPCWWRISLLDDKLFGNLTQLWLNLNPSHPWHLGPADLQITSVLGTPQSTQPWSNFSTYAQLYEQASAQERQTDLTFCTPTAFRQSQFDCALPTREHVFNSLRRRWNQYSGMEFPETLLEPIFPSFFDIRTELVADSRSKFIGCVGAMNFRILGEVAPLTIKQINTLADFALYSGVGRKTPMGMGMTRRLHATRA